jgi:hypothetical protein
VVRNGLELKVSTAYERHGYDGSPYKCACPAGGRQLAVLLFSPNGALQTNKVLVCTGLIYPWPRLTNYLFENQYLMYTKRIKNETPLHLHICLFKRGLKGGREREQGGL